MITGEDVLINGVNIFHQYNIRCVSLETSNEKDFLFNRSVNSRRGIFTRKVDETFSVTMSFAKVKEGTSFTNAKFEDCDYEVLMDLLTQNDVVEIEKNGRVYYLSPTSGKVNRRFGVVTITFDSVSPYIYSPVITQEFYGIDARFEIHNDGVKTIFPDLVIEGYAKISIENETNGEILAFSIDHGEVVIRGEEHEVNLDHKLVNNVLECKPGFTVIWVKSDRAVTSRLQHQVEYGVNYIHH